MTYITIRSDRMQTTRVQKCMEIINRGSQWLLNRMSYWLCCQDYHARRPTQIHSALIAIERHNDHDQSWKLILYLHLYANYLDSVWFLMGNWNANATRISGRTRLEIRSELHTRYWMTKMDGFPLWKTSTDWICQSFPDPTIIHNTCTLCDANF